MISNDNIWSLAYYYAMIEYLSEIDARPKNTYYRLIKEKPKKKNRNRLKNGIVGSTKENRELNGPLFLFLVVQDGFSIVLQISPYSHAPLLVR